MGGWEEGRKEEKTQMMNGPIKVGGRKKNTQKFFFLLLSLSEMRIFQLSLPAFKLGSFFLSLFPHQANPTGLLNLKL